MPKKLKRIGIFGGSFDPPHLGHLVISEIARATLELDVVFLVPAYQPPHKPGNHPATARQRLAMTKLLVQGNRSLRVSDLELKRKGISYTVDTVKAFHGRYPSAELYLILGGDSLSQFHLWRRPREILKYATLVVYKRAGSKVGRFPGSSAKGLLLAGPTMKISSSEIRTMIQAGRDIQFLVRENVRRYIKQQRLYV